jgi:glucose-1-phosphate adenylyltransferase
MTRLLPEYGIIADANLVCTVDLRDLLKRHIESGADLTAVCSEDCPRKGDTEVFADGEGIIRDARCHTGDKDEKALLLRKILVMKKSVLIELIDQGATYGWSDLARDFIAKRFSDRRFLAYRHQGYFAAIRTLKDYYAANMDLLDYGIRRALLGSETQILTKIKDTVPTMYGEYGHAANSLIADGCRIEAPSKTASCSATCASVKGVVVRNSIVMQGCVLEGDAALPTSFWIGRAGDPRAQLERRRRLSLCGGEKRDGLTLSQNITLKPGGRTMQKFCLRRRGAALYQRSEGRAT